MIARRLATMRQISPRFPTQGVRGGKRVAAKMATHTQKRATSLPWEYTVFRTRLGYMGMVGRAGKLVRLVFNYADSRSVHQHLAQTLPAEARASRWHPQLAERLRKYAAGHAVDFTDVEIAIDNLTPFTQMVVEKTRAIPYGQSMTYGKLADAAGYPLAGRAVGNVMRTNPIPLIVPCHRVIRQGGTVGAYSAPGGGDMKRRLLEMERLATERLPVA